uniref:Uncharacterized protein n=1 Tax=Arundo donax TaxID=35708 RepID=A0A0A9GTA7_ARUDO
MYNLPLLPEVWFFKHYIQSTNELYLLSIPTLERTRVFHLRDPCCFVYDLY